MRARCAQGCKDQRDHTSKEPKNHDGHMGWPGTQPFVVDYVYSRYASTLHCWIRLMFGSLFRFSAFGEYRIGVVSSHSKRGHREMYVDQTGISQGTPWTYREQRGMITVPLKSILCLKFLFRPLRTTYAVL